MKKILLLILILIFIGVICGIYFLNNKNETIVNLDVITDYLEIKISENSKIDYKDHHDNFFNEGYTVMKIFDENLLEKIKNSPNWRKNSDEYTMRVSRIKNEMSNDYSEISKIHNYYWIYKHNYKNKDSIKYIEQMDNSNLETFSYLLGIYDIDNGILYYYHMDN